MTPRLYVSGVVEKMRLKRMTRIGKLKGGHKVIIALK